MGIFDEKTEFKPLMIERIVSYSFEIGIGIVILYAITKVADIEFKWVKNKVKR